MLNQNHHSTFKIQHLKYNNVLRNYFRIAWRNLSKNKVFSFVNVFGLATALVCCILISVFVYDEISYDKYPAKAQQIYRVGIHVLGNGSVDDYPHVDVAVGKGMKDAFPEIASYARLLSKGNVFVQYGTKKFKEDRVAFVDPGFLQMFSIPTIKGNGATVLEQPNTVVITKAFSKKYFGNEEPIGKSLDFGNSGLFKVTGVIDKVPDNTHFHFDMFISMSTLHLTEQTWSNIGFYTYLLLNKDADVKKLEAKFPELVKKYVVPEVQHDMGVSLAEAQKSVNTFKFYLQPLEDIHLKGHTKYELEANGDILYVYIFGALAVFILLLACVNFTNLSTASASRRSKEVGIKKVMGSAKSQLITQFLTESVLLTLGALLLAYVLLLALLPYFNALSGKHISFAFFFNVKVILSVLSVTVVIGLLAGIYPAFFLSSFNPIKVLKGAAIMPTAGRSLLRSGLVVFQFFVSTALIIATIVVYNQLHYMQNKKLGYDKEQVLFLQDTYLLGGRDMRTAFKNQLLKDSRVVNASIGTDVPGSGSSDGTQAFPKDKKNGENGAEIHVNIFRVDYDYIPTLGIKMAEGRNFSKEYSTDSFAVVINQAAVRELGWGGTNPIGKTVVTSGQHEYKVIGVTEDFHYASVKEKIVPLLMMASWTRSGLIVKIKTTDVAGFLKDVEKQWKSYSADAPFNYYFADEKFASLYASEQRTGQIFTAFAVLAILIASLGLFGLAAFTIEQRRKEIGIRKVLGASVRNVLLLVSKDFLLLVGIAFIVAIPLTWFAMHQWLQSFAYRATVSWWIFIVAGLLSILIALFTISFRAIRAAVANPVKSLRSE